MNKTEKEFSRAVDEAILGSSKPERIQEAFEAMESQLAREQSSLGRYLESLRRGLEVSLKEMAGHAKVELSIWKAWEADLTTPTREELRKLIGTMGWTPYQQEHVWRLWGEASRFRLKRLTEFKPEFLAARGVPSESGIAWQSVDEDTQEKLRAWGQKNGYRFPQELTRFLKSLETEEAKETWLDEILGG